MPYRTLMIAPTSFFLDYGCHVRILEEARTLRKRGHAVKIVTYPLGRSLPGLDIERTIPIPWRAHSEVGPSRSKLLIDIFLALKSLQVAWRFKPTHIHAHLHEGALIGGVLARLLRVPLIFDFQGGLTSEMVDHRFLEQTSRLYPIVRRAEWLIDRLPHAILTSSQNAARVLIDEFGVVPARVTVLPDCVNADTFAPASAGAPHSERSAAESKNPTHLSLRAQLAIPPDRRVIVYIGLLDVYRGTDVLLAAAARVIAQANAHFVVIGFPNIERYQARARELGIADRVSFPGRIPYEDVPLWLALGEIAVEPKMSATEAAGKVLNYMAMGLPVVAFDLPVMREYLNELGVYAPLGDAEAFAAQILALLRDPPRARQIGAALRERAMDVYAWERAGREIERVYAALTA